MCWTNTPAWFVGCTGWTMPSARISTHKLDKALRWLIDHWPMTTPPSANDQATFLREYERCRTTGTTDAEET